MQFHSYVFFDSDASIRTLSKATFAKAKKDFTKLLEASTRVRMQAYSTLGFKAGTRLALNLNATSPDDIQLLLRDLMHTKLGAHLRITYTLLGMTHSSQYNPNKPPKEADWDQRHQYLVVYPFTKTIEWHLKPFEERRQIMWDHVLVGKKHNDKIAQRLLYSFGIDDHEFIVSYLMDDLEAFVQLVMEMRTTESRRHTLKDLPIFTCIHMPIAEALDTL